LKNNLNRQTKLHILVQLTVLYCFSLLTRIHIKLCIELRTSLQVCNHYNLKNHYWSNWRGGGPPGPSDGPPMSVSQWFKAGLGIEIQNEYRYYFDYLEIFVLNIDINFDIIEISFLISILISIILKLLFLISILISILLKFLL
jgi:hypothetical protein